MGYKGGNYQETMPTTQHTSPPLFTEDIEIVSADYVMMGPCYPSTISSRGYKFTEDVTALKMHIALRKGQLQKKL
jgi:hypothetical protein